ncbi:MAG: RNA pseudouridine synthase [Puniceicoccales bacterium]|nr:RNA pseudouridine synthase [Puniceicoccales bacterium]
MGEKIQNSGIQNYLSPAVELWQEDENGLVAIAKPPGHMAHPNGADAISEKALVPRSYDFEKEGYRLPDGRWLFLLHRLDAPTSGLMLVTLDAAVAVAVRRAFRERRCRKAYQAWVKGRAALPALGLWRDPLAEVRTPAGLRVRPDPRGLLAETRYEEMALARLGEHSLRRLRLYPHTGRTHQLRVQCALRGCPVLGDKTYGDFRWNRALAGLVGRRNLFLHSERIELDYRLGGKVFHFFAEQEPPSFWDFGAAFA